MKILVKSVLEEGILCVIFVTVQGIAIIVSMVI